MIKTGFLSFFLCSSLFVLTYGQETIISGKVTDAASGDPIPFVNVVFKGTSVGMTTDFDGKFKNETDYSYWKDYISIHENKILGGS